MDQLSFIKRAGCCYTIRISIIFDTQTYWLVVAKTRHAAYGIYESGSVFKISWGTQLCTAYKLTQINLLLVGMAMGMYLCGLCRLEACAGILCLYMCCLGEAGSARHRYMGMHLRGIVLVSCYAMVAL